MFMNQLATQQDWVRLCERLGKATGAEWPITITYRRASGYITTRTVEPYRFEVSKDGNHYMRTMDRTTQQVRSIRLDRILFYTVHKGGKRIVPAYEVEGQGI